VPSDPDDTPLGALQYPAWHDAAGPAPRPGRALLADPNYAWNERLYAMVWGAMFFPTNWSQAWINDARITTLGADQVDWSAAETYLFYNPASGLTYRAHGVGRETVLGEEHQRGTGARMLEWANHLVTLAYETERDAFGAPLRNADGSPVLVLDADGRPVRTADAGAYASLQAYADDVDTFRQLTSTFERSLGDEELPQP
jgi:hypothetical protein